MIRRYRTSTCSAVTVMRGWGLFFAQDSSFFQALEWFSSHQIFSAELLWEAFSLWRYHAGCWYRKIGIRRRFSSSLLHDKAGRTLWLRLQQCVAQSFDDTGYKDHPITHLPKYVCPIVGPSGNRCCLFYLLWMGPSSKSASGAATNGCERRCRKLPGPLLFVLLSFARERWNSCCCFLYNQGTRMDTSICLQQSVVDAWIQSIVSTQKMQTLYLYNAIELESKPLVTRRIRL